MIQKIISGGQTGADRAALDFAIKHNLPYGGWISKGRVTEDGTLPEKYHLQEMPTGEYSKRALLAFTTAAILEIGAYYVPWMDNLLDTIATPLAVAAEIIATASVMSDISPFLKWTIAIIAGGGIAGTIQTGATVTAPTYREKPTSMTQSPSAG